MWVFPLWIALVYLVFWIAQPDLRAGIPVPLISGAVFRAITVTMPSLPQGDICGAVATPSLRTG